ncbi:hypothetical protein [Streptomyces sp. NPDC006463]|uniref:hypothetical protein n=1 Tax=Streptomyces sp. NPDC006463 TaxID=3364746 RepID=UPI0036BE34A5
MSAVRSPYSSGQDGGPAPNATAIDGTRCWTPGSGVGTGLLSEAAAHLALAERGRYAVAVLHGGPGHRPTAPPATTTAPTRPTPPPVTANTPTPPPDGTGPDLRTDPPHPGTAPDGRPTDDNGPRLLRRVRADRELALVDLRGRPLSEAGRLLAQEEGRAGVGVSGGRFAG